jgi:RNA polymerase sigma factor (sigma-70 family)
MAISPMNRAIDDLRKAVLAQDVVETTDGQLLERFVSRREGAALEALVQRHGSMVWGVCRRLLNHHDAEDAFQATFLVLVRKAGAIVPREMVGNWLYGVAHQAALNARTRIGKRRTREVQVIEMPESTVIDQDCWRDLQPILDQELTRLPDKYRVAIVLCDFEGKSRKEVSRQLGLPEGTVASRLARARTMLAKRLSRHGLAVSGGTLSAVLCQNAVSACVPISAMSSTIKTVALVAAGNAVTGGVISAKVAALAEGVVKSMFLNKLKTLTTVLFVVLGAVTFGAGLYAHLPAAQQGPDAKSPSVAEKNATAKEPIPKAAEKKPSREGPAQGAEKDRIHPGDRLQIQASNTPPEYPIKGVFRVEPGGTIALGLGYGRIDVKGQTLEEAEARVRQFLRTILKDPDVSITRHDPVPDERVQALEGRVRQLEEEIRNLRAIVDGLQKQKGK